jgi:hypothetical protein
MAGWNYSIPDFTKIERIGLDLGQLQQRRVERLRGDLLEEQLGQLRGLYPSQLALEQARAAKEQNERAYLEQAYPEMFKQQVLTTGKKKADWDTAVADAKAAEGTVAARIMGEQEKALGEAQDRRWKGYRADIEGTNLFVARQTAQEKVAEAAANARRAANDADAAAWKQEEAKAKEEAARIDNLINLSKAPELIAQAENKTDLGAEKVVTQEQKTLLTAAQIATQEGRRQLIDAQVTGQGLKNVGTGLKNDLMRAVFPHSVEYAKYRAASMGATARSREQSLQILIAQAPDKIEQARLATLALAAKVDNIKEQKQLIQQATDLKKAQAEQIRTATGVTPAELKSAQQFVEQAAGAAPTYQGFLERMKEGARVMSGKGRAALEALVPTEEEFGYMQAIGAGGGKSYAPKPMVDSSTGKSVTTQVVNGRLIDVATGAQIPSEQASRLIPASQGGAGREALDKQLGKDTGKLVTDIVDTGRKAQEQVKRLTGAANVLKSVTFSTQGQVIDFVHKFLPVVGIHATDDAVAARQTFDGMMTAEAMELAKLVRPATDLDLQAAKDSIGSSNLTREAAENLLNVTLAGAEYRVAQMEALEYLEQTGNLPTNPAKLNREIHKLVLGRAEIKRRLKAKQGGR